MATIYLASIVPLLGECALRPSHRSHHKHGIPINGPDQQHRFQTARKTSLAADMDVDGGNAPGGGQTPLDAQQQQPQSGVAQSDIDIDMSFLQQFSCLGTTDHDELVNQLRKIMGDQLNLATARFFLEMNNW